MHAQYTRYRQCWRTDACVHFYYAFEQLCLTNSRWSKNSDIYVTYTEKFVKS